MNQQHKKIKTNMRSVCRQAGMTYVELIVVLGIFSILSSVAIFNYGDFQARVDIKNLASDIALKLVEAQKSASSGLLPPASKQVFINPLATWKPTYGVYFNLNPIDITDKNKFIYFTDVDSNTLYGENNNDSSCGKECLEKVTITKNNSISSLDVQCPTGPVPVTDLTVSFSRLGSGATIKSSTFFGCTALYANISISSPGGVSAAIKVYPSGRIQVN